MIGMREEKAEMTPGFAGLTAGATAAGTLRPREMMRKIKIPARGEKRGYSGN